MNKVSELELYIGLFSVCGILAITGLVLKITGLITWKWWVILLPIWGPPTLFILVMLILLLIPILVNIIKGIFIK